jgi:8-oxo-dGTP pyrophosphatase MutT (NUDIX family)
VSQFRHLEERAIHQGRVIRLVQASFVSPDDQEFQRDVVRSPGAVAIVAVDERPPQPEVVLVSQYRPAIDDWLVELPAGLRDKEGEPPEATAARELAEEAGLAAERYELLTEFVNAAGMTDQRTIIYLATGLRSVPNQADGLEEEYLSVERRPLAVAVEAAARGELIDAKTVIGLLLAERRLRRPAG